MVATEEAQTAGVTTKQDMESVVHLRTPEGEIVRPGSLNAFMELSRPLVLVTPTMGRQEPMDVEEPQGIDEGRIVVPPVVTWGGGGARERLH